MCLRNYDPFHCNAAPRKGRQKKLQESAAPWSAKVNVGRLE